MMFPTRRLRLRVATARVAVPLTIVVALGVFGCSAGSDDAPPRDHVRAIVMPYLNLMPFYIAAEEGYFEEARLDVEFVRVSRNQDIMAALATGDVDVAGGMLTVNELALALTGSRIRMIAAMGELSPDHCPNAAMVVRREVYESGALNTPDGIRGLRFDLDELIPIGYWADMFLGRYGLGIDDVNWVSLPSPAAMEAMKSGAVDVILDGEPFASMLAASGDGVIWEGMEAVAPHYVVSMLMYGARLIDDEPEVGRRFAVALLKGIRQYGRGKTPANLAIVQKGTDLTAEQVENACWSFMRPDARLDPQGFRGYQEWLVARGLIDRVVEDNGLVDQRFMDYANDVLGDGGRP